MPAPGRHFFFVGRSRYANAGLAGIFRVRTVLDWLHHRRHGATDRGSLMRTMQKIISAGFATCALVSASVPALAWTVWPDVDFEWYAAVGKPMVPMTTVTLAPREGYIVSPGHWETRGTRQVYVEAQYVKDDY